jgi:hypothetical protein
MAKPKDKPKWGPKPKTVKSTPEVRATVRGTSPAKQPGATRQTILRDQQGFGMGQSFKGTHPDPVMQGPQRPPVQGAAQPPGRQLSLLDKGGRARNFAKAKPAPSNNLGLQIRNAVKSVANKVGPVVGTATRAITRPGVLSAGAGIGMLLGSSDALVKARKGDMSGVDKILGTKLDKKRKK